MLAGKDLYGVYRYFEFYAADRDRTVSAPLHIGVAHALIGDTFNPRTDAAYTIEVMGRFYTRALSVDTDTSYWTVNYDDLLVITAAYLVERRLGSRDRAQYWLEQMQVTQTTLDKELVEAEQSGMNTELGAL